MADAPSQNQRIPWRIVAAALLCVLGCAVAGWALYLLGVRGKLSAATSGALSVAAGSALVLGVLLFMRVREAALVATVLLEAGALVAVLVSLGAARAKLSLTVPLGIFVLALVAVAMTSRARWQRPWAGFVVQGGYVVALGIYALAAGGIGATAWLWLLGCGLGALVCQRAYVYVYVGTEAGPWKGLVGLPRWARALLVFGVALAGFAAAAGPRLAKPSPNNHFVYLADCYLHGRLSLGPKQLQRKRALQQHNDWAKVERIGLRRPVKTRRGTLRKGTELRGDWLVARRGRSRQFRTTRGQVVVLERQDWKHVRWDWYVSFPPLPAVLMAPGVAVWGYRFNDAWFSLILAALSPMLLFLLLGRLRGAGLSCRDESDDLWLTLLFAFGTVNYFVSVQGEVWYTAQVVGVLMLLLYLHASLEARHPALAGLALGCALASRVTLALAVPIFLAELLRVRGGLAGGGEGKGEDGLLARLRGVTWRKLVGPGLKFAGPLAAVALLLMWHNWARFDSPFEFGHRYLDIVWKERIQQFGLFDVHYLARNLAAAFTLLPHFQPEPPYVLVSLHGLSLLFVTPALLLLLWPLRKGPWHRPLWLAVGLMAGLVLLYQNTGFVQFSYRFALDFMPLLILLIALGGRRLSTPVKILILVGVLLNLFGALTFGVAPEFYGRTHWVWTPLDPRCAC